MFDYYRIMLSRLNIEEERYSRDQRAFVSLLEKMLNAAKEGILVVLFLNF